MKLKTAEITAAKPVALAAIVLGLALAPQAEGKYRDEAKFKVLSVSGTQTGERRVTHEPSEPGNASSCVFSETERISFHSTERVTAYVFSGTSHGRLRTSWSPDATPDSGLLSNVEVPGEATVSRSVSYEQTEGCYDPQEEPEPKNCTVERTLPVTLVVGGTSDPDEGAYVEAPISAYPEVDALDDICRVEIMPTGDNPGVFRQADLFDKKLKRLRDIDRVEEPAFDNATDDTTVTGSVIDEVTADLKRRKLKRPR